ncbi:MAG: hydrogenase maturation nickel metallochaperone HypA [Deltaproteobacteria bacterium]|nr:hydrogenase maturation nickel metallochaperone HypA [Deltaproteobacteria bacterium]MBI3294253.1 hydrogenase maturation nickel metallochaperone HypA [Deltaproteobacteria bacterium]
MHEASLMKNLMEQIEKLALENKAERVTGVKVQLGALSHFTPEHFREHFEVASRGTKAAEAKLDVKLLDDIQAPDAQNVMLESIEFESV